jgi:hypothetical protein
MMVPHATELVLLKLHMQKITLCPWIGRLKVQTSIRLRTCRWTPSTSVRLFNSRNLRQHAWEHIPQDSGQMLFSHPMYEIQCEMHWRLEQNVFQLPVEPMEMHHAQVKCQA